MIALHSLPRIWRWLRSRKRGSAPVGRASGTEREADYEARIAAHLRGVGADCIVHMLDIIETKHGHRLTKNTGKPMDAEGRPLPWYTYPAIEYLDQLDLSDYRVLEFGSGQSSLYFASRARSVMSIERDRNWHAYVEKIAPKNLQVLLCEEMEPYVSTALKAGERFDIIVVDGEWRRESARAAMKVLSDDGLLILDNSDWFPHTSADLRGEDLLQVDFTGLGPVNYYSWTTSLFFRRTFRPKLLFDRQPMPGIGSQHHVADAPSTVEAA